MSSAPMMRRRELLGIGSGALVSCARSDGAYFGSTAPPSTANLVHLLNGEIDTLDAAKSIGSFEFYVMPALFEGLTQYHPELPTPMASLATHYEVNADFTQYRFYLRGHPAPQGIRLLSNDDLPDKFLQGLKPAPDSTRAYWSDGKLITADDFVYSWRRFVDPQTAAPLVDQFYLVKNGREIISQRRPPSDLGVHAPDEFTLIVDLESSVNFFPELITSYLYAPVPRHVVEAARSRNAEAEWTNASNIVTSGPFTLREHKRYERLVLVPNPRYYDAHLVRLKSLTFLPIIDGTTVMNLYKAGEVMLTPGLSLSPLYTPALSRKKDFHAGPGFGTFVLQVNTQRTPFDNVLLRYALNMATEKKALTDFLGPGFEPARSYVPPVPQYAQPDSLRVEVDGRFYDVLAFDVEGARSLLAKAGFVGGKRADGASLEVPYHFAMLPDARLKAQIVQQQWQEHLNVTAKLMAREFNVHWAMVRSGEYTGVADFVALPLYLDPNGFLENFSGGPNDNPSRWADAIYRSELVRANTTLSRAERMTRLAECEKRLLQGMPLLPCYHAGLSYLCKPFIRGVEHHLFDMHAFKYVWIDTNWRPQ